MIEEDCYCADVLKQTHVIRKEIGKLEGGSEGTICNPALLKETHVTTEKVRITGMTCDNCARHVKEAIEGVRGVASVAVSLKSGKAVVTLDGQNSTRKAMVVAVSEAGYQLIGS